MKYKSTLLMVLCLVLGMAALAAAGPQMVIDKMVYEFESVPEGIHIDPVFIVKNTGDAELQIESVLPP